jgi:hypothetical protein
VGARLSNPRGMSTVGRQPIRELQREEKVGTTVGGESHVRPTSVQRPCNGVQRPNLPVRGQRATPFYRALHPPGFPPCNARATPWGRRTLSYEASAGASLRALAQKCNQPRVHSSTPSCLTRASESSPGTNGSMLTARPTIASNCRFHSLSKQK